ncbi:MAG: WbqC family protein, partial [Bdellovibrionales bacterium]|nr:WbqC family protein [Bdellovibrionales bacterium]
SPRVKALIDSSPKRLLDLNIPLIEMFRQAFGLKNRMLLASELGVAGQRSGLLAGICEKLGATTYLSGPSGRNYLNQDDFSQRGIAVKYHEFNHPEYSAPKFAKFLSAWDLLMNHGPESAEVLGVRA